MEANAQYWQYALHDAEATAASAPQWAAHVRLTPELLEKLTRGDDAQISIRLNASGVASLGKNKKTSVLTVTAPRSDSSDSSDEDEDALSSEQYELLSFPEDPRINHVCTFRKAPSDPAEGASTAEDGGGYAIYRTGTIHQKLIVQRLLDSTEKDRMKDRHARSVRESKARSSKLIDAVEGPPDAPRAASKRRRLAVQMRTRPMARIGAKQPVASAQATTIMQLPSALSLEEAKETRERIEAGFEQPVLKSVGQSAGVADAASASDASVASEETATIPTQASQVIVNVDMAEPALPVVAPGKPKPTSSTAPAKRQRKCATKDTSVDQLVAAVTGVPADEMAADSKDSAVPSESITPRHSTVKSPMKKKARKETPRVDGIDEYLAAVTVSSDSVPDEKNEATPTAMDAISTGVDAVAEPQPAASTVLVEETKSVASRPTATVKRPLKRSVPMPDLSFFPQIVAEICERVARHKSRSAIIDEADYDAFVEQYESFQRDWETLDKAYSIEFVRCEGLHLQLELASTLEQRVSLNNKLQASARKKEGLLFVQSTMATMQKLLAGIQASVLRFDRK